MLFVLTGAIQTGKTRWLESLTAKLAAQGVPCFGVLSPGVWREEPGADGKSLSFEKLGIETVLLPKGERLPFAQRRDLVEAAREGKRRPPTREADRAALGWAIRDEALARVNAHFDQLAAWSLEADDGEKTSASAASVGGADNAAAAGVGGKESVDVETLCAVLGGSAGLLVIDEFGRLELEFTGGFTSAVRLLEAGPCSLWPNALIVVRDQLASAALLRFGSAWTSAAAIHPGAR